MPKLRLSGKSQKERRRPADYMQLGTRRKRWQGMRRGCSSALTSTTRLTRKAYNCKHRRQLQAQTYPLGLIPQTEAMGWRTVAQDWWQQLRTQLESTLAREGWKLGPVARGVSIAGWTCNLDLQVVPQCIRKAPELPFYCSPMHHHLWWGVISPFVLEPSPSVK